MYPFLFTGIIEVSLDRPQNKNAIDTKLMRGLRHVLELLHHDSSAHVAIFTSSVPGVYCAGADLKVLCSCFNFLLFKTHLKQTVSHFFPTFILQNHARVSLVLCLWDHRNARPSALLRFGNILKLSVPLSHI